MTENHAIVVGGTRGLGRGIVELWAEGSTPLSVMGRRLPETTAPFVREADARAEHRATMLSTIL